MIVTVWTKVALNVTPLLGMLKVHGLLEHEIPCWVVQPENCQPGLGEAVTITDEPTVNEPPFALTEPWPLSTPITKGCWTTVVQAVLVTIVDAEVITVTVVGWDWVVTWVKAEEDVKVVIAEVDGKVIMVVWMEVDGNVIVVVWEDVEAAVVVEVDVVVEHVSTTDKVPEPPTVAVTLRLVVEGKTKTPPVNVQCKNVEPNCGLKVTG